MWLILNKDNGEDKLGSLRITVFLTLMLVQGLASGLQEGH